MESDKQIRENAEKDIRTNEKVIRKASKNCKNAPLEKISENDKNDLKFLRKKHA